jgi:hypothetical protein
MTTNNYPIVLSFDVGVIHLSYCLMTQKPTIDGSGNKKEQSSNWHILDWNNIDLMNRDDMKCDCGAKASLTNNVNGITKYYCKTHAKKVDIEEKPFENMFIVTTTKGTCNHIVKDKECGKNIKYCMQGGNMNYCTTHAKLVHKTMNKGNEMKSFKLKSSKTLNFDDVKYDLIMVLEGKPKLLEADYVVIENQPSFKNPRMKSIASTLYDYYMIRGIVDKERTKSNITQVKFMSPSNKLKLADSGDTKQLVKVKKEENDTKAYKLTKSLGIKYCTEMVSHLPEWLKHFNSFKKKDDMADSFLQGAYFYLNSIDSKNPSKNHSKNHSKNPSKQSTKTKSIEL